MRLALPKLSLFGRSISLLLAELAANAICWIVAGILFGRDVETRSILNLALLAWTLGLRHGKLGTDQMRLMLKLTSSAIDNATRGLISLGQLPVTCGLFFSLGHSTIVIVVTIAIAISSGVYEKMAGVGTVGRIVGAAVSGSFLFIIGVANTIMLWRIVKRRIREKKTGVIEDVDPKENHTLMMRVIGPIVQFVNRPWKMYPVGVLFGLGFDTASSIALLGVSALAQRETSAHITSGDIIILPLLFTAGMTFVDSVDSVLMLYSYAGIPEHSWRIFEPKIVRTPKPPSEGQALSETIHSQGPDSSNPSKDPGNIEAKRNVPATELLGGVETKTNGTQDIEEAEAQGTGTLSRNEQVKRHVLSGLSIVLTLMSILVAFSISLITIMSLIGEECRQCREAAEAEDGGGLAGSWWRAWAQAGEQSGYIGAAIVGTCLLIVAGWYGGRRAQRGWTKSNTTKKTSEVS